jgi:hypothetical protein
MGPPGSAKSSIVTQVAKSCQLPCEVVIGSIHAPEDFSGVAVQDKDGDLSLRPVLAQARRLAGKRGVLFLDELTTAPGAVQAAMLRLVLDRKLGDMDLGGGVRIMAAANPPEEAAGGSELAMPLANRFCHIKHSGISVSKWITWLISGVSLQEESTDDVEKIVREHWDHSYARAAGHVAGFVHSKQDALHAMPAAGNPARSGAYPTPRSWDMACRAYATCLALKSEAEVQEELLCGCIGIGHGNEFFTWVHAADLPDPYKILEAGKWEPDTKRLDRTMAVLSSLTSAVTSQTENAKRVKDAKVLWSILGTTKDAGLLDLISPPGVALVKAKLGINIKELMPVAMSVIQAIGMSDLIK